VLHSGEPAAGAASAETAASGEAVYSTVLDDDRDIRRAAAADTTGAVHSMRIAVLGAGGIGGYDGALLSQGDNTTNDERKSPMTSSPTKTALITGASGGIGRSVALRLARDGFAVVVNYAGSTAKAEAVVNEIKSAGGQAIAVQADVANAAEVERLFKNTLDAFGRIDVVVNCAGIMPLGRIADGDMELFDKVIATNLRGTFIVLAQAARHLREGGRIMAFSSSVLAKSFPTYGPYIASKAGVEGLVRVLNNELRGRNVTVNALAPGPVATELFLKDKTQEQIEQFRKIPPLERLGQPEDIANVVSFLAGPDGGWVNGQVLRANGGFA
jgi:3-oxoacyl-[acyl-carrier protein] reductase